MGKAAKPVLLTNEVLLDDFSAAWNRTSQATHASPMTRLEWMAVQIFAEWVTRNYSISRKRKRVKP